MTNEEKAIEIANNDDLYNIENGCIEDCRIAALEMAKWKDEQELQFLQSLIFQSSIQNIFDMINERAKLLKGE
jgi:hypothetical protein